ncbi:MAG: sensor histidine kinase, partial [Alphaproteobacteria bacterium]
FLASVSHELRTPLTAIVGFAEMIAREQLGAIAEKRYPGYAEDIIRSAQRLQHILSDILDMAQLESGRMRVQRESLTLAEVAEEALAQVGDRAPAKAAPIAVKLGNHLPRVWTDRARLRQILLNLVSNALAFTAEDGTVVVSACLLPGGDMEISVADSGRGMTPEEVRRAVTRFGHADDEQSRGHQGIGLGLPLAKSLTQLLGGTMRIASVRGEGTTVTLRFPPEAISENAIAWKRPADRMAERRRRLLGAEAATEEA